MSRDDLLYLFFLNMYCQIQAPFRQDTKSRSAFWDATVSFSCFSFWFLQNQLAPGKIFASNAHLGVSFAVFGPFQNTFRGRRNSKQLLRSAHLAPLKRLVYLIISQQVSKTVADNCLPNYANAGTRKGADAT